MTSEVRNVDKSSFGGLFLALGGILFGLFLEGGRIAQIVQPTAAMIVFGGTLGAVLLQFPLKVVFAAVKRFGGVFVEPSPGPPKVVGEILKYAHQARKKGIVCLDSQIHK